VKGVGAKMGIDATKPLAADEMVFKRIRVPGEEAIDVADLLKRDTGPDWKSALK
jgi:2,5-furandicarboxylate decarboxylase 1